MNDLCPSCNRNSLTVDHEQVGSSYNDFGEPQPPDYILKLVCTLCGWEEPEAEDDPIVF